MSESIITDTSLSPRMKQYLTETSESDRVKMGTFIAALRLETKMLQEASACTSHHEDFEMNDNSQHPDREYLGDSVYVDYNSTRQIVLQLENGMGVHTEIVLEPEVFDELVNYVERMLEKYR